MGFWDDFGNFMKDVGNATVEVTKFTGEVVAVETGAATVASAGGLAVPLIGGGTYLIGKGLKEIGKEDDNDFLEGVGDVVGDVGLDGLTGGLFSLGTNTAGHLAAKEIFKKWSNND